MKLSSKTKLVVATSVAALLALIPSANAKNMTFSVGGASSVASLMGDCKVAYSAANEGDSFAYASSSSGQGQKDMEAGKVDFAFSDSPHTTSQSGKPVPATEIHVPALAWPIGIEYKDFLNGKPLALSTTTVAKIFAGKITKWNDPAIVKDNSKSYTVQLFKKDAKGKPVKDKKGKPIPAGTKTVTQSLSLPNQPITVIYRGDSSGTTGNLLAALSQIDPTNWPKADVKGGTKVFASSDAKAAVNADPIHFQGANGSAGVAQLAAKTDYSITYSEVNFAKLNKLGVASIINKAGDLVQPDDASVAAQIATADIKNGIVTQNYVNPAKGVYPFSVVTYALVKTTYGQGTAFTNGIKSAIEWHAFNCPVTAPNDGFIKIDKTSTLGQVIVSQLAKIGA
jgi:phosphate transport system substrate-binding protein